MTPAQLDILLNGAFIYERHDGSRYASFSYKLQDLGVKCVGRSGRPSKEDLEQPASALLDRLNAELVAGAA